MIRTRCTSDNVWRDTCITNGLKDLRDGTSCTGLVSEKRYALRDLGGNPGYDNEGYICGWDWDVIRRGNDRPLPDLERGDPGPRFGSSHPAGVNVLLGDGSVRGIPYTIDILTWASIWHRADGHSVQMP